MKVILCGYHWTGCKALELLLDEGHEVFVYTHKAENCVADLAGLCEKKRIKYSLEKIGINNMPFKPDIICSIYYRFIIDSEVIDYVNGKIFNLHPALLPKYRGCSSLTWAIINGEQKCGYTYHYIDAGCDTGDIILQKEIIIEDFDTQLTLYNRVMFEAMKDFIVVFKHVVANKPGIKQNGESSYYKRGCPFDGIITNEMDDKMKERFIRAMIYPPYPVAQYEGNDIRTFMEYQDLLKKSLGSYNS
ncbi:formyltransferase family protein [Butyrivibrio fibrisolvens]|uniref:formyltransferase family protein n=1 Tax=Butyrivibrio fibrisolvens TaxID=831 RepID=UPI000424469C|nr:formyltransferase family protein [Butyrivibrio fibrisolvens]